MRSDECDAAKVVGCPSSELVEPGEVEPEVHVDGLVDFVDFEQDVHVEVGVEDHWFRLILGRQGKREDYNGEEMTSR